MAVEQNANGMNAIGTNLILKTSKQNNKQINTDEMLKIRGSKINDNSEYEKNDAINFEESKKPIGADIPKSSFPQRDK